MEVMISRQDPFCRIVSLGGTMTLMQVGSVCFWQQATVPWSRVRVKSWSTNWAKMVAIWVVYPGELTSVQKVLLTWTWTQYVCS